MPLHHSIARADLCHQNMRIAHVTDCYLPRLGGIELQVHDLAERQSASHDVSIITSTAGEGDGGVGVIRVCGTRGRSENIRYRSSAKGLDLLETGDFDLVHVHASSFSPLAFLAARRASQRGVPTVATVHSLWAKASPLFDAADTLARWGRWPVIWSAVSSAAAEPMQRILGERAAVAILANGVDPAAWTVAPEPGRPGELRVAVVCRLAPRKRPYQLLQTLRRARARLPEQTGLSVDIVGEGPERPRIERYLRRHDMDGWVRLHGRIDRSDIRDLYARTDLFVAPAHLESFGIAALEARCAGLPILALSRTGVRDFVTHGVEGWLVDSDRAMLETIVSLATSPALLRRVARHNRSVEPAVSWPSVLERCEALYRSAAHLHGRVWTTPAPTDLALPWVPSER
jgi:glycosyltransferase involved in cell wall biosynthesis